jgi:hypothetical protein
VNRLRLVTVLILLLILEFPIEGDVAKNATIEISRDVYFPGESVFIKSNFLPEVAYIISPVGIKYNLTFFQEDGEYLALFELKRDVVLGNYILYADGVEREFTVDFCSINATYSHGLLSGRIETFFSNIKMIEFSVDGERGFTKVENGSFLIPLSFGKHEVSIFCGSSETNFNVTVNFSIVLDNETVFATLDGKRVNASFKVYADRIYEFRTEFNLSEINSTEMKLIAKYMHLVTERVIKKKEIEVPNVSFPGENVTIKTNFDPEVAYVLDPAGRMYNLSFENVEDEFIARILLNKSIVLGRWTAYLDGIKTSFFVDSYAINASFNGSAVTGRVKYYFIEPDSIYWKIGEREGYAKVINGSFTIPVDVPHGNYTALLRCGNSEIVLEITVAKNTKRSVEVDRLYFVGDVVEVKTNFKPELAYIKFKNESREIEFKEINGSWIYEFFVEEEGLYQVVVDDIAANFTVEDYSINSSFNGSAVVGYVSWHYVMPEFVKYTIRPFNLTGEAEILNGSFTINVPPNTSSVLLECGNAKLEMEVKAIADMKTLEFKGMKFNVSIDRGKFDELTFDGENVTLRISGIGIGEMVNVSIGLPFEIPEGMYVYYWKMLNGTFTPVNYTVSWDRRHITFELQDGVVDEDGKADGIIFDPIKLYIPRFDAKSRISKDGRSGIVEVRLKENTYFEIKLEVSRGNLSHLAFVDSENLPSKPVEFPYQLVKFKIDGLDYGEEVEVRITYPSLEGIVSNGSVRYYKFNPDSLTWYSFVTGYENNTVVLKLKDGGFGDDDGKADGAIVDDGGVGWAGYSGEWSASVGMDYQGYTETHTYWIDVPGGDNFNVSIFDGDGLEVRVYYPNGTIYNTYFANGDARWDTFTVQVSTYGWWKLEIFEDAGSNQGNNYGLNITGTDEINVKVNESYVVNGETFFGSPDAITVYREGGTWLVNPYTPSTQTYYVIGSSFKLAIYDPDSYLELRVYDPDGNLYGSYNPTGDEVWRTYSFSGKYGVWKIYVNQTLAFNDYILWWWWIPIYGYGNYLRLAVNLPDGLWFKQPALKTIKGRVLEDFYPLGRNNGEDAGIQNVTVALFRDDGNGTFNPAEDEFVAITKTNRSGYYSFRVPSDDSTYFIAVDSRTVNTTRGLNSGYTIKDIWGEQTYQTEWSGDGYVLVQKFGGQNPEISDNFGTIYDHYTSVNLSSYNDESVDFGFSFDVIVNIRDADDDVAVPIGEVKIIPGVGSVWRTVHLSYYYQSPVIVCSYDLPDGSSNEAVVRINNVQSNSFDVMLQNPAGRPVTPGDVHCVILEEGVWTLTDGRRLEAHKVVSDGTNENNNWNSNLMENVGYSQSYTNPVVLGQVMSYNDSRWSVFWCSNGNRLNPPDSNNLYVGKHVGEDTVTERNNEVLGYIVVEQGSGVVNGIKYEAALGEDSIRGVDNDPPYSYALGDNYAVGIASQNAMDGGNGGWAVLYGSNPVSNVINLAIDEDTVGDAERSHTSEQVAYLVFDREGILLAESTANRTAQGTLRQFILNANAIAGADRSYFVMMVDPNVQDGSDSWWTIAVNTSLGELPAIKDDYTELNGTVFYPDLTVRDANSGYVLYDYSTKTLRTYSTQTEISAGIGSDGIPFSGDEARIKAVPKPEIEIYGNGLFSSVLNITADSSTISSLSIFGAKTNYSSDYWNYGSGIKVGRADTLSGSSTVIRDNFIGLRANASDPESSGLNRNEYTGVSIYSNNTSISNSIVAYNGASGILFWGKGVNYGVVSEVQAFRNGIIRCSSDGFAVEGWIESAYDSRASNVKFENCLASKNAGFGIDSWFGKEGLTVINCTLEFNGLGNESGVVEESGGIRILANRSLVTYNLIRENSGAGVVIGRMANYSTYGIEVTMNSIYNNTRAGIDIDLRLNYHTSYSGDNVTLNDGLTNHSQPNNGIDHPVITSARLTGNDLYVEGFIGDKEGDANFAGSRVEIYMVKNLTDGDDLWGNNISSTGQILDKNYGEGWIYLGYLIADSNGNFAGSIDVSGKNVDSTSYITGTAILNGDTSEFGPDHLLFTHRNVGAALELRSEGSTFNVTIGVTAFNQTQDNVRVYWIKPQNLTIDSMSGDYYKNGSVNGVYWWEFSKIDGGETLYVNITLSGDGDYRIIRAMNIGVDPYTSLLQS